MKKTIIILIILSIILVIGCSYDQKLIEEQNNEQEQIIQDLKREIENLKYEVEWRDKRMKELAEIIIDEINETDKVMREKAYIKARLKGCEECLDFIEDGVVILDRSDFIKDGVIYIDRDNYKRGMDEIVNGTICMRMELDAGLSY